MIDLRERIIPLIQAAGLPNAEVDAEALADTVLSSAEENVMLTIIANDLSEEDREVFRDAYQLAPDIFDTEEYLRGIMPDYEVAFEKYAEAWLVSFEQSLSEKQ